MSPYEVQARERKASAIAMVLAAHDVNVAMTRSMPGELRELAAKKAGQKKPSETTWARVVEIMEAAELMRLTAKMQQALDTDPFAGLTEADVVGGVLCR